MIYKEVTTSELKNYLNSKYALVLAHADFCGPCTMMKSEIQKLDREDVNIAMIKIDDNQDFVIEKQIFGTPVLFIYKDGKEIERIDGFLPAQVIEGKIK